jgi:hypothetical protein
VELVTPLPGTVWCTLQNVPITWNSAGVTTVLIEVSSNGGASWKKVVSLPADTGSYSWEIPSNQAPGTDYRIRIRNAAGNPPSDAMDASFTINGSPYATILSPATLTVPVYSSVTLIATSTGTPKPTVQWEKSIDDLDYSPVTGARSDTLTLTSLTPVGREMYYRAVYTNSCGSSKSDPVFLTVTRASATVTLAGLDHIYDGSPKAATVTTIPAGLGVDVAYSRDGAPVDAPTEIGSYVVIATIVDSNYTGMTTGILVINAGTGAPDAGSEIATGVSARVVPNPLGDRGEIHIDGLAPGMLRATIHDIAGRPLKSMERMVSGNGTFVLPIDIDELASGFYTVRITTSRDAIVLPMQIVR